MKRLGNSVTVLDGRGGMRQRQPDGTSGNTEHLIVFTVQLSAANEVPPITNAEANGARYGDDHVQRAARCGNRRIDWWRQRHFQASFTGFTSRRRSPERSHSHRRARDQRWRSGRHGSDAGHAPITLTPTAQERSRLTELGLDARTRLHRSSPTRRTSTSTCTRRRTAGGVIRGQSCGSRRSAEDKGRRTTARPVAFRNPARQLKIRRLSDSDSTVDPSDCRTPHSTTATAYRRLPTAYLLIFPVAPFPFRGPWLSRAGK